MRRTTTVLGVALGVALALTGCAVRVTGTPIAAATADSSASTTPEPAEVLRWTRVTDGATGTTAELPVPANPEEKQLPNADPALPFVKATVYQAQTSTSGTVQLIIMMRAPNGNFDNDREVRLAVDELKGTLTGTRPVSVDGHPGIDYTITYTAAVSGKPSVVHTRFVEARDFAVRLTTRGVNKDPATVAAVHQRVAASLKVPAP